MSSKEQELSTTKSDDDKPDSSLQTTAAAEAKPDETPIDSGDTVKDKVDDKSINDGAPTECGDSKQTTDDSSKAVNLNKISEFDDEDDFNSDEMQLRWDDDEESMNGDKLNIKAVDGSAVGNKEAEENSSKEILDDIDKLIGNDDVDNTDTTDQIDSKGAPKEVEKTNRDFEIVDSTNRHEEPKESKESENYDSGNKINAVSTSSSKDLITKGVVEREKPGDTSNLNESSESVESINESNLLSSTMNDSLLEGNNKVNHGLKKPDMMLEIPTQELIDCMDDFDSDNERTDEKSKSFDVSQQICSLETDIDDKSVNSANLNADLVTLPEESLKECSVQSLGKSNDDDTRGENTKIVKDSLNDVEMGDFTEESVTVLPSTKSDKDSAKTIVANRDTSVDISLTDANTKNMSPDVSLMDIDESKTPEKDFTTAPISDALPNLEIELTPVSSNTQLDKEKQNKGKSDNNLSIKDTTLPTTEIDDKESYSQIHKVSTTTDKGDTKQAATNVLEAVAKNKDAEIAAVIKNTDSVATTSTVKSTLKVDTEKQMEPETEIQDASTEIKSSENMETSEDKPTVNPSLEPPTPLDKTASSKCEEISTSKEINEPGKVESTTKTQITKDTLKSDKETIKTNEVTASKDTTNEPVSPNLDPVNTELTLKDPVSDQPSTTPETSTKDPPNEEPVTPIIEPSSESKDVVDKPTTSNLNKQMDQVLASKDPPKDPPNEEPATPIIEPSESIDIVDQPSTSKHKQMDQVPDTTDEVPEMEDTLGLLAESSRVIDADAEEGSSEGGDAEEDEEGDDDDFDPDDESSNQMTAEHSEESNAQMEKEDGQTDKEEKAPEQEKTFDFAIASGKEKAGEETEVNEDAKDAIAALKEVTPSVGIGEVPETGIKTDDKETSPQDVQAKDNDSVQVSEISSQETAAAANSILKELLNKEELLVQETKSSAGGVVDLESSSEDDEIKKKIGQGATSGDKESVTTSSQKVQTITTSNAEVFNLDSDDDEVPALANEITIEDKPESNKCINPSCQSGARTTYVIADAAARAYFDADKKKKHKVCLTCAEAVVERTKGLVNGIKEFTPLLQLDLRKVSSETVEISDSDSDDGDTEPVQHNVLGESGAKFLEDHLADVINETWLKYNLDQRLGDAQSELDKELEKLEAESKEIDTMLNECQVATDLLRNQLYATFEPERRELSAICIMDTPMEKYSFNETTQPTPTPDVRLKRKSSASNEQPAKRAAIPLGYTPLETESAKTAEPSNDEDKDVSVVKLSAESAPSDLPPPGEIVNQPLRAGMSVYAMRNSFCTWVPGKIIEIMPKIPGYQFTMCRVRLEIRQKTATRSLAARCLAYIQPAEVRLTIGTRVIALSQENGNAEDTTQRKTFYSGIVAEIPNPVNSYRYLIFFDHGYAQYVPHSDTRVVCESASLVWEEVHPNSRDFVRQYLLAYPERPMVRLHRGQSLKTEWNGKWWVTKVLQVDASLVEVSFADNRTEWIYRGSTRLAPLFLELQAAERQRSRPLPRSNQRRMNMPYVEYTRSDEQNKAEAAVAEKVKQEQQNEELRRQRAVAKKSTASPAATSQPPQGNLDSVTSRVVYYTPKNAVKPLKMTPHTCSPKCKRTDVLALKDLRTYNPLAKPLLSGWERQIVRYKGHKEVSYRAPCGRRLRTLRELHRYLRDTQSDMGVDLFDFGPNTHCLAEFVLNKCLVGKKDLSHGKENVPVPCVNYYDESLPEFCSYNTERTPTAGVPLNLDPDFLCGCDCTDDCEDKSKCACWKMTLEGARTIGLQGCNVGYEYKRLPEPLPSGIYECNSRCKCKQTCLNRVAQHPLQLKLQVFKTMNRGWGIRALNDVPKGSFLCVYAGNLLTDATANLDGLNEGDEYLAELDYIEVVEQMKEGYEEDIPEADKKLDRESSNSSSEEDEPSSEEEDNTNDKEDGDFQPGYIGLGLTEFNKRLRKRDRTKKKDANKEKGKEIDKGMENDGCITISDDEEAKEPTQFTAQTGIGANEFVPKYKSVRTLFGKDEACYIMDAKVQGNIGRYLNHSCTPNVFVQNVFVDTHDPRFPWVAFFALSHIRAGTELTWNYNYDVGSVPGKVLYCYCGAPNCRGRLL